MSKEKVEEEGIEEWSSSQSQRQGENSTEEEGEYEEVVPRIGIIWLPEEEGEELIGEIIEIEEGQYGIYGIVKKENGSEIQTPAHKVLQSRIELLSVGDRVKIEFRGTAKSQKGHNTRLYRVRKLRSKKDSRLDELRKEEED